MADFVVSPAAVTAAAQFMRESLQAKFPNNDYSEGNALSDLVIDSLAPQIAYLAQLRASVRNRSSLLTLLQLPEDDDVREAVDGLLGNLFLPRNQGSFTRGTATVHLSERVDVNVPPNSRLLKSASLRYFPDVSITLTIPASALRPIRDVTGTVVEWTGTFPIVAENSGSAYDQASNGVFNSYDRFNPFLISVTHDGPLTGGREAETNTSLATRAPSALALRSLVNARSNNATLTQNFSYIEKVTSIGMGDEEMHRDVVHEFASNMRIHIGGHSDIYTRLPVSEITERLIIGDPYPRPDGKIITLRDVGTSFIGADVRVGDILYLHSGIDEAPFQYVIETVRASEIDVSTRFAFSEATVDTDGEITYTVGNNYPDFNNKVSDTGGEPKTAVGGTSANWQTSGAVLLPARPVYQVKRVAIQDVSLSLSGYSSSIDGAINFSNRVFGTLPTPVQGASLSYKLSLINSDSAQSALAMAAIEVGGVFDTQILDITYDTVNGFDAIDSFVRGPQNRIIGANTLVRAPHPIYVGFTVPYSLTLDPDVVRVSSLPTVNTDLVASQIEAIINRYQSVTELNQSYLATQARAQAFLLSSIYPFDVDYTLHAPDGKLYKFRTSDILSLAPDSTRNTARLLNPAEVGLPTTGYEAALARRLQQFGVSRRTVRYIASPGAVAFSQRS